MIALTIKASRQMKTFKSFADGLPQSARDAVCDVINSNFSGARFYMTAEPSFGMPFKRRFVDEVSSAMTDGGMSQAAIDEFWRVIGRGVIYVGVL